jgi:hypothetical protein
MNLRGGAIMRRWWPGVALLAVAGGALLMRAGLWGGGEAARPLPVPGGDHEVAWLHIPTSGESWENFVWGMKRAEAASSGAPGGLRVDDSEAFPARTTAVPEIVVSRDGFADRLRVRWYKVTNYAPTEAWVKALAERNPPPLAVVGGWSSDRAKELAAAMAGAAWPGQKPVLLLAQATADSVYPDVGGYPPGYQGPKLIELYPRAYRFCFTNRQMADAVADFVLTDPALRPGPAVLPGLRAVPGGSGGLPAALPWLGAMLAEPPGVPAFAGATAHSPGLPAFAVAWKDDPYSLDLSEQFRDMFHRQGERPGRPHLTFDSTDIHFSVGRFARPNPYEAQVVDQILANLPRRGERTVLVIPTVTAPARRVLGALAQGAPGAARRLVAVTGDGISVNTLYRDGEFAWPVRSIPIPLVLFTHADPFDWDEPGKPAPPRGYELRPPARAAEVKNSTEEIQLFTEMTAVLARGAFPDGAGRAVDGADALAANFARLAPAFFDPSGNRLAGSGEHVVVLRPTPRIEGVVTYPDAVIEVWTRQHGEQWGRIHARPVVQTVRPADRGADE